VKIVRLDPGAFALLQAEEVHQSGCRQRSRIARRVSVDADLPRPSKGVRFALVEAVGFVFRSVEVGSAENRSCTVLLEAGRQALSEVFDLRSRLVDGFVKEGAEGGLAFRFGGGRGGGGEEGVQSVSLEELTELLDGLNESSDTLEGTEADESCRVQRQLPILERNSEEERQKRVDEEEGRKTERGTPVKGLKATPTSGLAFESTKSSFLPSVLSSCFLSCRYAKKVRNSGTRKRKTKKD
jgi:hypothetical protein